MTRKNNLKPSCKLKKNPNLSYKCILDLFIQENDGIFLSKSVLCCRNDLAVTLLPLALAERVAVREGEGYAGRTLSCPSLRGGFPLQEGFGTRVFKRIGAYRQHLPLKAGIC